MAVSTPPGCGGSPCCAVLGGDVTSERGACAGGRPDVPFPVGVIVFLAALDVLPVVDVVDTTLDGVAPATGAVVVDSTPATDVAVVFSVVVVGSAFLPLPPPHAAA